MTNDLTPSNMHFECAISLACGFTKKVKEAKKLKQTKNAKHQPRPLDAPNTGKQNKGRFSNLVRRLKKATTKQVTDPEPVVKPHEVKYVLDTRTCNEDIEVDYDLFFETYHYGIAGTLPNAFIEHPAWVVAEAAAMNRLCDELASEMDLGS